MRELRAVRTVLTAPLTRRTWTQAAYCLLSFVPALAGFVLIVGVALALGSVFTLTVLGAVPGILFLVAGLALARGLGALQRRLARGLIGERVEEPPRPEARRGLVAGVWARLRDASAWRAVAYVLVKLPLATLGLYAVLWWVIGAINVIAPLRWAAGQHNLDLVSPLPGGGPRLHSLGATFAATALGCAILLIAPWLTRAVVAVDRRLLHALLGPGALAERVRDLQETRALAVDDAAEQLRRLERDLHDGAQVRLAALAMNLDMVREQLDDRDRPELRRLVETARDNAIETLTELRDLSHGLHPPALDEGTSTTTIDLGVSPASLLLRRPMGGCAGSRVLFAAWWTMVDWSERAMVPAAALLASLAGGSFRTAPTPSVAGLPGTIQSVSAMDTRSPVRAARGRRAGRRVRRSIRSSVCASTRNYVPCLQ